jgi:hypothetical protein
MPQFIDDIDAIEYARSQWDDGAQRMERFTRDSRRRTVLEHVVDRITAELDKRVGQSFGMLDLVRAYDGAETWALALVHEAAPDDAWAWDLGVVLDAAFSRYVVRAQDYEP